VILLGMTKKGVLTVFEVLKIMQLHSYLACKWLRQTKQSFC